MAQGEGFKHITVTAPEEDDVVIVAGAKEPVDAVADIEADEPAPLPAKAPESSGRPPASPGRANEPYRETTLRDLESTPMPLAQRVVIAAAIICIIGAVIYYLAFMG